MDPVVIAVIAVAVAIIVGWMFWQRQRTSHLHTQYGREYDRTVDELGRFRAQRELSGRERRVSQLQLTALTREQRDRFAARWREIQAQFVDDPEGALMQGDRLVEDVIDARGYPISDFDTRIADLSVHHARIVPDYRSVREIARRHREGDATTEDLRQALVHFRTVFEDLLEDREHVGERVVDRVVEREDVVARAPRRTEPLPHPDERRI